MNLKDFFPNASDDFLAANASEMQPVVAGMKAIKEAGSAGKAGSPAQRRPRQSEAGRIQPAITESDFATTIEDALTRFGWLWCHYRPARTEQGWRTAITGFKGMPDYIAVRNERLLFIELKSEKGRIAEEQKAWLAALRMCQVQAASQDSAGNEVPMPEMYLWKPSDFETAVRVLR